MPVPSRVESEEQLEDLLSEPTPEVIDTLARLPGDVMVLGVAGKMGPSLARMVVRASRNRRVLGVARFSSGDDKQLRDWGVEPIRCDLLDDDELAHLPEVENIICMVGRKFGSTGDEATTWAVNCYLPGAVCRKFRRSRIVAFSTGNVYPLVPVDGPGSREDDALGPVGEYAQSCLGRERLLEYHSRRFAIPMAIIRLNYACDLRYGVLVDVARRVWAGESIDRGTGYFNTIWQGDANVMTLRAFDHLASPPWVVNMTGPERLSVSEIAGQFGAIMGRVVRFTGGESSTALLSDARLGLERLGPLRVPAATLLEWVADWVMHGGRSLGKPTHFEARDGRF